MKYRKGNPMVHNQTNKAVYYKLRKSEDLCGPRQCYEDDWVGIGGLLRLYEILSDDSDVGFAVDAGRVADSILRPWSLPIPMWSGET